MADLVAAAEAVAPLWLPAADEAEHLRRLPSATVDALVAAGLMRMGLAAADDGPEADPLTMLSAIEIPVGRRRGGGVVLDDRIDDGDAALFLEPPAARRSTASRRRHRRGVRAERRRHVTEDGVVVTGRWQWGSGTQHCQWILGGTLCDDGTFRLCWSPSTT